MDKTLFHRWFGSAAPAPIAPIVQETTQAMAERGDAEAQFHLGLRYAVSFGASQDYALAEHWYLKAAAQNHPMAHFNLGMMYGSGHGAPRDQAKSLLWIQKAADLGDAGAQYNLGSKFQRAGLDKLSDNITESRIDAYKWLQLAATQGYKGASAACEMVNIAMSHEDVQEGMRRVAEFNAAKALAV